MKYSIITVNYNNKEGLRRTIESVVSQTFRGYEYIVIDGGSTDGSVDVLKEYDSQITYWVSEKDGGIYQGMNKGIHKARGEYLNFMNSGDCFYSSDVLQHLSDQQLTADLIVGRDYHYNATTQQGFCTILPPRISMVTFYIQTLPHQSTFFKRKLFSDTLYDESLRIVADIKFYIQKICVEGCSVALTDEVVCRREPDGVSRTYNERRIAEHQRVLAEYLPQGARNDYDTLSQLDKTTLYKLLELLENVQTRKWLTYLIKIIYRMKLKNRP
jgi:glycosyltransferase involved in cell wall biosynthesis